MLYKKSLEYINMFGKNKIKLGLERMLELMNMLGNPQNKMSFIHIGGTNGKGSVANYLSNILKESGQKVGIFTSPYLTKINQSIAINMQEIKDQEFADTVEYIKSFIDGGELEEELTSFELLTAVALQYFYANGCDIVALEVGMGGALDSTNIITTTKVAVLSSISLDHTDFLGDTITAIAKVKSGIIKPNCQVVIAPQAYKEVYGVIEEFCNKYDITPIRVDASYKDYQYFNGRQSFVVDGIGKVETGMLGIHQIANAKTAIAVAKILGIDNNSIVAGICNTKWQCRLEMISDAPKIFVDGGHNLDGILAIVEFFKQNYAGKKVKLLFGALKDKQYYKMIQALKDIVCQATVVNVNNPRTADIEQLGAVFEEFNIECDKSQDLYDAIENILEDARQDDIILITGSLYYVGVARDILKRKLEVNL